MNANCEGIPQQIHDGDVIVLQPDQHDMIQECCNCGLKHHFEFRTKHNGLRIAIKSLGMNPDLSGFDFRTEIQDADGNVVIAPKQNEAAREFLGKVDG